MAVRTPSSPDLARSYAQLVESGLSQLLGHFEQRLKNATSSCDDRINHMQSELDLIKDELRARKHDQDGLKTKITALTATVETLSSELNDMQTADHNLLKQPLSSTTRQLSVATFGRPTPQPALRSQAIAHRQIWETVQTPTNVTEGANCIQTGLLEREQPSTDATASASLKRPRSRSYLANHGEKTPDVKLISVDDMGSGSSIENEQARVLSKNLLSGFQPRTERKATPSGQSDNSNTQPALLLQNTRAETEPGMDIRESDDLPAEKGVRRSQREAKKKLMPEFVDIRTLPASQFRN